MKKKVLSAMLVAAMGVTMLAGCGADGGSTEAGGSGKEVITLYAFTDEVPGMVDVFMQTHPDVAEKYEVKTTIVATTNGEYQPALDAALQSGGADQPDMYCAEAAFVLKYTQGDASQYAATYKELGIDVDAKIAEADIAQYSVDIGTRDGEVVGLGYQATGGAFIYRRSIAQDVFGSDDPAVVGEAIGAGTQSWDKYWEAADALKAKGYAIVSGDGDIWHAIENSSDTAWVVDGKLNIDPKREAFLDVSKKLTDEGYSHKSTDWEESWFADMKGTGTDAAFGFFGPAWLINYTISANAPETAGDWAVCPSPVGFFWGGTWVLGNTNSSDEKKAVVGQIIEWITLDTSEDGLQYMWANGTYPGASAKDSVGSGTVMSVSDGSLEYLGGQNMFEAFVPANQYANGKNLTQYDETINRFWRDAATGYANGTLTRDEALDQFKTQVAENLDVEVE